MNNSYFSSVRNTVSSSKPSTSIRLLLIVLFVLLFGNVTSAQTQTFSANGTWTCPPGVSSIDVKAWGAGAGGQGGVGGGGGGAYAGNKAVSVTPGFVYQIIVGIGGSVGVAGGDSSVAISSTVLVKAEGGGKITITTGGSALNSIGSPGWVRSGGNGIDGYKNSAGGGGGGSAGAGGNGFDGTVSGTGGAGGVGTVGTAGTAGAAGGAGGTFKDGAVGNFPGGGGGERYYSNGSGYGAGSSGAGGSGQVIISWCSSTKSVASTTTWTVTNGVGSWDNGYPTNIKDLVFNNNYSLHDVEGCSCKVNSDAAVSFTSGKTLKLANEVTVSGGSLTFEDSASLVQINNVTNSGNIIYKRNASSPITSNYTYWSSPVASQTLDLSSYYKLGNFYSFDNSTEAWTPATIATTMLVGQGYIAKGPILTQLGLFTATFTGVPNNGPQSVSVPGGGKSILLGNPYPSAIDAKAFIAENPAVIDGTLYFWTHITGTQLASTIGNNADGTPKAGSGANAYTQDDYAVFNSVGGTKANNGGDLPSGFIAAGQSFFTTSSSTGGVVKFSNAMRVAGGAKMTDGSIVNGQFFKTRNVAKTINASEKHRVWLNLSNTQGAFKQTLIGYITYATNEYDSRFDGESFDGNEFVDFYSINQDKNLVIQGRALPFDENDEVPLGFRSTIEGPFTINIDQADGILTNQTVFIEDKLTNTVFDLKSGNYIFKTVAGTFDERFVLRYTNKTLGTSDFDVNTNKVLISTKKTQIQINSFTQTIDKVTIYDLLGRQIYQKNKVNSTEILILDFVSSHQTLIVKTSLQNGKTVTDKIIY